MNDSYTVMAIDKPGDGGAHHKYVVAKDSHTACTVKFQKGPIKEFGFNGCTQEDLLAIVIDRLECFQAGNYACTENQNALDAARCSLAWLEHRTASREKRGVEGINQI